MHHAPHGFAVLPSILLVRLGSLASPQLGKNPISNRRLRIYIAVIGRRHFIETLTVDPLISVLAAKPEHNRATGHAEAAQEDHHEEKCQLLEPSCLFFRKDLLELHLESLILYSSSPVTRVDEQLLGVDQGVALPLDIRTCRRQLKISDQLLLVITNDIQLELLLVLVEVSSDL